MNRLIILAAAALGITAAAPNADARTVYRTDGYGDRVVVVREGRGSHYYRGDDRYRTYRSDRYYRPHRYDRYDRYDDDDFEYRQSRRSLPRRIVHGIFNRIF